MHEFDHSSDHFVLICTKCRGSAAASKLRASLAEDLPKGFAIRAVECMAGCDNPTTIGFQAAGKAGYLFGDIEEPETIAAITQFAHQYQESVSGWTSATERPAALCDKTLARLPALKVGPAS